MTLTVRILEGGYCTHKEKMVIRGGRNETVKFPSMFGLFVHPKHGAILYDTGYTKEFYRETANFPFSIYAKLTPVYVQDADTAVAKLAALKIRPEEVNYIIISHFHADHIAALRDFPKARFVCLQNGYEMVSKLRGFKALRAGFLPGFMPPDFLERALFLTENQQIEAIKPFTQTFDLFGDGTVKLIPLPGHYRGQLGALVESVSGSKYFMIADSCWLSKSYRELIPPHFLTGIIMDEPANYRKTLANINLFHQQNKDVFIIPSHCQEIYEKFVN